MCLDSCCANFAVTTVHICIPLLSLWVLCFLLTDTILELFWAFKRTFLWFTLLAKSLLFQHSHMLYTEYQHFAFHISILVRIPRRSETDIVCHIFLSHLHPFGVRLLESNPLKSWSDNLTNKQQIKSRLCLLVNPLVWLVTHIRLWSLLSTALKRRCRQEDQGQIA